MSTPNMVALFILGSYTLAIVGLAVMVRVSSTAVASPPATDQPSVPSLALIDIDIALLQISVVPPKERTAAEWVEMDRLLDERSALALPRRQPSVPVIPGWSS